MKFIATLRSKHSEIGFLSILSVFCFSLTLLRIALTDSHAFLFLNWNLFLAAIPFVLTYYLIHIRKKKSSPAITGFVLLLWMLFFPNAPYILTDLFHLRLTSNVPIWFDFILIMSFAWTGLIYGFRSLAHVEILLKRTISVFYVKLIIPAVLMLTGFGIYLGRYARWNSWDILRNPLHLLSDVGKRVLHPAEHPSTWGMTLLMGTLLLFMYESLKFFTPRR